MGFMLILVLVALGACGVAFGGYYYNGVRSSLQAKASSGADFFANYVTRTYAEYYQSAYQYTELFDQRDRLELQFISTNGKIEVSTYGLTAGTLPGTPDIADALRTGRTTSFLGRDPATGERIAAVSSPLVYSSGKILGVIRYVTSLKLVDRQVFATMGIAVAIGLALLLVTFMADLLFIRSIVTPIREVTGITRQIADGGYGTQIQTRYPDEIGEMVGAINDMSIQIGRSEKVKSEFISSVSHELRTPLTAIGGWAETLSAEDTLDRDTLHMGLTVIREETRRLRSMVEELLVFSRIEDGRFTVNIEKLDIEAELEDAILAYRELLKQEGIRLEYTPPDEPMPIIPGDPARLRQVFLNILDNAAKHGGEGKRVVVTISLQADYQNSGRDMVCIRIRDFGPGIPIEELGYVKQKFYRGSSKARGSGIGLSVCDEIIRLHGGLLDIDNAADTGCVVSIRLPTE